ncbi:MAG: phytanoyl-CoA dioxygenase family protein [Bryobacteraceae bacterium]
MISTAVFSGPHAIQDTPPSAEAILTDTDPRAAGPGSLQGVALLTDVERDGGGYQCLPNIYQNLEAWLERNVRGSDFDFFNPGLNDCETIQIEGKAGDVILWSTKLPHGSAANLSDRPRIAAFVSMQPPAPNAELRASMKRWWLSKQAPDSWRGLPGQLETEPGAPAALSELGMKLIGVLPWG